MVEALANVLEVFPGTEITAISREELGPSVLAKALGNLEEQDVRRRVQAVVDQSMIFLQLGEILILEISVASHVVTVRVGAGNKVAQAFLQAAEATGDPEEIGEKKETKRQKKMAW